MGACTYMHPYTQAHMYKQISLKDDQCHHLTKFWQTPEVSSSSILLLFFPVGSVGDVHHKDIYVTVVRFLH